MGLFDETATLTAGQDPGDTSTSGIASLISTSDLLKKAIDAGAVIPNNNSLRDFESFVLTNPDLVDPGIDVSGLRTITDTREELLSNIPDYAGIQFDPTRTSYLDDLYALYSGQLPMTPVTPAATTPAVGSPANGGGGGGVETPATITPSTPITTDLTDDQINEFAMPNNIGGITGDPITVENIGLGTEYTQPDGTVINIDPLEEQMLLEELYNEEFGTDTFTPTLQPNTMDGAPVVFDINQTGDPSQNPGSINVGDQPMAAGPFDYLQQPSIPGLTQADITQGKIDEERLPDYTPSFEKPEQESTVQNILGKAGQTVQGALTELGKIPGAIADFTNQTVDVFGKKLNVGKTLTGLAINKIVGAPVSLVFAAGDVLGSVLPQDSLENITTRNIVDELKSEKDYGFNIQSGNLNQDPFGRNPVSQFNNYEQTLAEDAVSTSTTKMGLAKKEFAQDYFNKKASKAAPQEDIGATDSLDDMLKDQINEKIDKGIDAAEDDKELEDIGTEAITADDAFKETGDYDGPSVDTGPVGPQFNDPGYTDPGADAEENQPGAYDGYDDFDDGTMTGAPASTTDEDPIGGFFDAVDKAASDASSEAMGGDNSGFGGDTGVGQDAGTSGGTGGRRGGAGGNGGDGCFLAGTLVTMADGSTKPVEQVDLKDNVAEGGKVFATGKFLIENLYDYKGIKVSGSHMVHEDDNWVRVEDSKHGKPLGNDEHTVYVFGSENRRILIDGILFTDYFEVNEQNILIKDSEDFFNNSKNYGKIIDKQNVDILNAS